jgi:hypothetical protein
LNDLHDRGFARPVAQSGNQRIARENTTPLKLGKLRDKAFQTNLHLQTLGTGYNASTNPYDWETKIEVFRCASFPGEEDVASTNFTSGNLGRPAVGNYIAMAATHIRGGNPNNGDLESSGSPPGTGANTGTGCAVGSSTYCGNGTIVFPGVSGGTTANNQSITSTGRRMKDMSDGTSKTVVVSETREEKHSSWYSGLASYGVGAWPKRESPQGPPNTTPPSPKWWTFGSGTGQVSLNKGDRRAPVTDGTDKPQDRYYMQAAKHPHDPGTGQPGDQARKWGPSSAHPGVVQHGWGDGRGSAIAEGIDGDVYLHLITRNGRETSSVERGGIL